MYNIEIAAATQNTLGECPLWHQQEQALWWTDIQSCKLYRLNHGQLQHWTTPERLCSFGFSQRDGELVAAFASGFALYRPETGAVQWLAKTDSDFDHIRLNDGRCDRFGRFFAGGMVEAKGSQEAKLYKLDCDGSVHSLAEGIQISNSLCWSPDNNTLYFADSPKQTIWAYDYDGNHGSISNQRVFARTTGDCFPDGATVDSEGFIWNAQWGGSQVVRYAPDGSIAKTIKLPVSQPSCVSFGGANLDQLYVTTARENLSAQQLDLQPLAGSLLRINTEVTGLAEGIFKNHRP